MASDDRCRVFKNQGLIREAPFSKVSQPRCSASGWCISRKD